MEISFELEKVLMAKERLDMEIEEKDEKIAELKPKINRMQV